MDDNRPPKKPWKARAKPKPKTSASTASSRLHSAGETPSDTSNSEQQQESNGYRNKTCQMELNMDHRLKLQYPQPLLKSPGYFETAQHKSLDCKVGRYEPLEQHADHSGTKGLKTSSTSMPSVRKKAYPTANPLSSKSYEPLKETNKDCSGSPDKSSADLKNRLKSEERNLRPVNNQIETLNSKSNHGGNVGYRRYWGNNGSSNGYSRRQKMNKNDNFRNGGWIILDEANISPEENFRRKYKSRREVNCRNKNMPNSAPLLLNFSRNESELKENLCKTTEEVYSDSESVCGSEFSCKTSNTAAASSGNDESEMDDLELADVHKNATGVIGVFWDIENCSVPEGVSCREIVKKIRNTFYGNRKERDFIVVCDYSSLPKQHRMDLIEERVELVHVDYGVENVVDFKSQDYLRRFVETPNPEGSCVVLISGDSDFASELQNLRYTNQIFVVLIHNRNVKQEICDQASQQITFEDFVKNVSRRELKETEPTFLLIGNIPLKHPGKTFSILRHLVGNLKGFMKTKLVSGSCTARFLSKEAAKIAVNEINQKKDHLFGGHEVNFILSNKYPVVTANPKIKTDISAESQVKQKREPRMQNEPAQQNHLHKSNAVLLLESIHRAEPNFWKGFLRNIIKDDSVIDIIVHDNVIQLHFGSLSSAKKARKIIENDQKSEFKVIGIQKNPIGENFVSEIIAANNVESLIAKYKSNLENKCKKVLSKHNEKITEVEAEISGLKEVLKSLPSNTTPSEWRKVSHSLQVNEEKMLELIAQEKVFQSFVTQKIASFDECLEISIEKCNAIIATLQQNFGRECHLFLKALPIYAMKIEVHETVEKHAVSIILAETGSGKSTQIIQFLNQTKLAETGQIVCTQPRRLAARSLADYVSQEMGCTLGRLVGLKVGMYSKTSDSTRILYMTDYSLLNECMTDPMLERYSCVIVDEVHQRSIFTDLLLGMLKTILQHRPEFKVVLTSATMNPKIFQDFFGIPKEAVLKVSGRVFPIEIVWNDKKMTTGYDYVNQAVLKAFDIHTTEEAGHILIFVTSPAETHRACENLENMIKKTKSAGNAVCLPLHGKLPPAEQQRVFSHVPNTTRKIIFSTSCAETSITIAGIRYVVDTGMGKELRFDPRTECSVLKICVVTRSSAEQRKGRAGRTQPGKCYRLFSKEDYDEMIPDTKPEIMRVNLGQAILKLMQLGVEDPCNFQFVESPPQSSFLIAMDNLSRLGAVENGKLTELGSKMAKFQLEPSLSKLIVRGYEENIGYEAVITAALASISGSIFYRIEENRLAADLKKTQFCQEDGDFHTFLEVYKGWVKAPRAEKTKWCVANFINIKSMKITYETIKELLNTCEQELNIPVSAAYSSLTDVNTVLQFLLLEVFSTNLCIYSGHSHMGYISSKDFSQVHVHASSSLHYLGHLTPQFVVFQTNFVTSRPYILSITPVSEECLNKAIEKGICEATVVEKLRECALAPLHIGPYGLKVLKQFCGFKGEMRVKNEQEIAKEINEKLLKIEVNFSKGLITVCCKRKHHECAKQMVDAKLQKTISEIQKESQVITIDSSSEGIGYLMGAGAVVTEVIMPREFISFSLRNLNSDFDMPKLKSVCNISGYEYSLRERTRNRNQEIFLNCKRVIEAADLSNTISRRIKCTVIPQVALRQGKSVSDLPLFQLEASWIRRPCIGIGYVKFKDVDDFFTYSPLLTTSSFESQFKPFRVGVDRKDPHELILRQLHPLSKIKDLREEFSCFIPDDVEYEVKLLNERPFETTDDDLQAVEMTLADVFSQYTREQDVTVRVLKTKPFHAFWRAKISFKNARDGQTTFNAFKGSVNFPGTDYPLEMTVQLNSTIMCHKEVYDLAKSYIEDTVKKYKKPLNPGDHLDIKTTPCNYPNNFVSITITSNNLRDLELVRNDFHEILKGEKIECLGKPLLEKLFLESGKQHLRKLEKEAEAKIHLDYMKRTISIMGVTKARSLVKIGINSYVDLLVHQSSKIIRLSFPNRPKGLLKCLFKEFDYSMERLQTLCGLGAVELNIMRHCITVFGSTDAIQKAEDIVNRLSGQLAGGDEAANQEEEESCPVCLSPVEEEENPYRLQICGHIYCQTCIQMQIKDCNIPLVCVAQDCNNSFVMEDFRILLGPEMKRSVSAAALKQLAQKRSKEFKYCPTPECPVVYKVPSKGGISLLTCSHCKNQICTRCNAAYHQGMSCEMFENSRGDEDFSVKLWMKENSDNRKQCPKCNSGIEKNGGCNHITCWSCSAHICWLCMKVFPTSTEVYGHQAYCPQNQGNNDFMF